MWTQDLQALSLHFRYCPDLFFFGQALELGQGTVFAGCYLARTLCWEIKSFYDSTLGMILTDSWIQL